MLYDHDHKSDTYHIYPARDLRDHVLSPDCWCKPKQDDESPNLYVHNSMDGREDYEEGRKLS